MLSNLEEARFCHYHLEGVEEHLNGAFDKAIRVEVARTEAAVRSKGEFARLQKECDLCRQRTASVESEVTVLHKKVKGVTAKVSDLGSENAMLQK